MKPIGFWSTAFLVLVSLLFLMFIVGTPARSQEAHPPCMPAADLQKQLAEHYGETVTAGGAVGPQGVVFITTNPKTHTFTILIRKPDGMACLIVGGTGFALADPARMKGNGL